MGRSRTKHTPSRIAMALILLSGAACEGPGSSAVGAVSAVGRAGTGAPGSNGAAADIAAATPMRSSASEPVVRTPVGDVVRTPGGYLGTGIGCARDLSARALDRFFARRLGPVLGVDNPHTYRLDRRRTLWLFHDAFMDYSGKLRTLTGSVFIHNLAMVQVGRCFTLLHRGTTRFPASFEQGDVGEVPGRFFWPLGGGVARGRLYVFWAETLNDPNPDRLDGIRRHPVGTWLAVYDARTLERLDFRRAPDDGVFPQYGFAVASDNRHTYLFGNSNLLNLSFEGGYDNGPHSATRMYLARVPLGRYDARPAYRTRHGWSRDPDDAVPISRRFWTENTMQPKFDGKRWIAVTKVDGFWGNELVIDVARRPWGPWRTVVREPVETRPRIADMLTYQPILVRWRNPRRVTVMISQNHGSWATAVADPSLYRPRVFDVTLPR